MEIEGLKLKAPKYNNKIEIFIEGDVNDADYVSETSIVSIEEFRKILPVLKKIKNSKKSHNWEDKEDYLSDEEIDLIYELDICIPSGENYGPHTITEIQVWFCSKEDSIRYEVKL